MDADICQSCGNILRQRLRFCTCCGSRLSGLSTTLLPHLSESVKAVGTPVESLARSAITSTRLTALSLERSSPDLNCDQCAPRGATTPPVPVPFKTSRDTGRDTSVATTYATSPDPKTHTAFSGIPKTPEIASHSPLLDGLSQLQPYLDRLGIGADAAVRWLSGLPMSAWAVTGGAIAVLLLCLSALPNSSSTSASPALEGKWAFQITDFDNNRTFNCNALLTSEGPRLYGVGSEGPYQFQLRGDYYYPRVRLVKSFTNAEAPIITFEGIVESPDSPDAKTKYLRISGSWWRENEYLKSANQWQAVPYAVRNEALRVNPLRPQAQTTHAFWQPPFGEKRPGAWAQYFLCLAAALIAAGLGLVLLSSKLFGPSGLLNIWEKKQYIPSQFKAQHRRVLAQFGKPLESGGLPLGTRVDWNLLSFWLPKTINMPAAVRNANPHVLIVGASSKGKTHLAAGMVAHDIRHGRRSVVVVDSDGSLVDLIDEWISQQPDAAELRQRVIQVDPARHADVTYNPLSWRPDDSLQNVASAIVFGFKAIYNEPPGSQSQWSQQTADILRNAAILLMANGKTLVDLPVLLTENDFRDILLERIEARVAERPEFAALLEAWSRYKRMARTDQWINWIEPILNRINPMLGDPRVRSIMTPPEGSLDLERVLKDRRILLVRIPNAQFDQSANLLGSLLVTGLKQGALRLSGKPSAGDCSLYLDEFDRFVEKETFDSITSETRRFRIAFVGVTKTLQDLPEDYRNQLVINAGTLCCFALGKKDGDMLGPQMFRVDGRKIKHQTLQNLFNKVNTTPTFELITDEEKLNIDRVVGQEERTFFCYQVGTIAGVFQLKAHDFPAPSA